MDTMLLQFKHQGAAPSMDEVRRLFSLQTGEIDTAYGVIATDPSQGLYTVLVDAKARGRVDAALAKRPRDAAEGLFANPRIQPFGPPEN